MQRIALTTFSILILALTQTVQAQTTATVDMTTTAPVVTPADAPAKIEKPAKVKKISGDTNGNGKIEKSEYMAQQTERAEKRFAEMDANSDGAITPEERTAHDNKPKTETPSADAPAGEKVKDFFGKFFN